MTDSHDDLERRIADSLRNRAGDVTPSPELWTRVEATVNRTRTTWALAIAGAAIVAAAAAVVLPAVFDDDAPLIGEGPSETPTTDPTTDPTTAPTGAENPSSPSPVAPSAPDAILATDSEDLFLVGIDGTRGETLYEGNRDDERSLVSFSIRPGGTAASFDAIVLFGGEGGSQFAHLRVRNEGARLTTLPDRYQPNARFLETPTRPAFSPDGRHVAWVEMPDDEQAPGPTLQTIGWTDDGPGTGGNTADDNANFTLDDLPLHPYRVEDWVWDGSGTETSGHLVLRATGPEATIETVLVSIGRQSDGALFPPSDGTTLLDGAIVDRAETDVDGQPIIHELVVGNGGSQDAEGLTWTITHQYEDGQTQTVVALGPTADPGMGWMDAVGEWVLVGHGSTMLLVDVDGQPTSLTTDDDGGLYFGALLPAESAG